MLVRDGDAGLEVFMLRRTLNADFVGGAYVFPGGAVDDADRHSDLEPVCEGRTDAEASALLGVASGGLAYWVAAIRECFEEAGVLLAHRDDGEIVHLTDPDVAERFARHRTAVHSGERRLVEVCREEGLRLAVGTMHYFSHWITPEGAPRRYDTRFFVTAAPAEQTPLHDDRETIANLWTRPADALERYRGGDFDLVFPTFKSLETISRFDRAADLLDAARAAGQPPLVQPRVVLDERGVRILLPGDPGYDEASPPPDGVVLPVRPD
ncbi:MAG: NUDIX hydrolase [Actinobacteria bacterium]|nr:MAG: NUDIX hydrolase [Actinomycetota bacterium]